MSDIDLESQCDYCGEKIEGKPYGYWVSADDIGELCSEHCYEEFKRNIKYMEEREVSTHKGDPNE